MYFVISEDGVILMCSSEATQPGMVYMETPADFKEEEMHDWRVLDGVFYYEPLPKPDPEPSAAERITALEAQVREQAALLAAYEAAYAEGVSEA